VPLEETIKSFKGIVNGDYDHIPETAFYMIGSIHDIAMKYKKKDA
jgi:F-type H+-transporting ATPase subunit beta